MAFYNATWTDDNGTPQGVGAWSSSSNPDRDRQLEFDSLSDFRVWAENNPNIPSSVEIDEVELDSGNFSEFLEYYLERNQL